VNLIGRLFRLASVALWAAASWLHADEAAAKVVILANRDDPDSLRLARYYAEKRGVPASGIVALQMPLMETISWPEFIGSIWQPLQAELIRLKRIDAISMNLVDDLGRRKQAFSGHDISYLVVCRGVPLRIAHAPAFYKEEPPTRTRPEFRTNQGAVDSELALLAQGNPPINGFVPNPLFRNERLGSFDRSGIIKVSRLDGPTYDDARALVDHAIAAERHGLIGRAYVDTGGINPEGDRWLEATAAQIGQLGFPLTVDREPLTLPASARFDAPVLYFGWYTPDLNGPLALPGFRFPEGAIALHIHSFSAETLHSATQGWCGPLVARGVTATVGNVFEPYLQLTHVPNLLWHGLASGMTFGDAVFYSLPALSWQEVAIGDPLYRPFAVPLELQVKSLGGLTPRQAGYVVLREVRLLEANAKSIEGLDLLQRTMTDRPSLAVALALAERLERKGEIGRAVGALKYANRMTEFQPDEWALARLIAVRLEADEARPAAVELWRKLLADRRLPSELRTAWLVEARQTALLAGNVEQVAAWDREFGAAPAAAP
jgi:uncharacterized protein (TIGR03790 family)